MIPRLSKHYVLLAALLLVGCGGGGGDGDDRGFVASETKHAYLTVVTGSAPPRAEGNTIIVPCDFDPGAPAEEQEARLTDLGNALQIWAGLQDPPTEDPTDSGCPAVSYAFTYTLYLADAAGTKAYCTAKLGRDIDACAHWEPKAQQGPYRLCQNWLGYENPAWLWGHELAHCLKGPYHP